MHRTIVCLAMIMAWLSCTPIQQFQIPSREIGIAAQDSLSKLETRFQKILDHAVNEHQLVGAQISIRLPDGSIWNGASGTTDLDRRELMKPSHVIRIGSLAKTYTAVVVFRLIERGVLGLDSTIARWLPEYKQAPRITLRMLLSHASGIPDLLGMRVMLASSMNSRKVWTPDELLDMICARHLEFEPGTEHRYSNSNYVLLGIIAERATGKSLRALYRDEIFSPLSLHDTYFLATDHPPPELVTGYDRSLIPLPGWHVTKPDNTAWSSCAYASGAMAATASDVLRFFSAILNREIISDQSFRLMTEFIKAKHPKDKYLENFGMGLFQYGDYYRRAYGHLGLFIGSEAIAIFSPEKEFILVFLANVSRIKNSDAIIQKYLDMIVGHNGG
ncbi:MAG: beta-lactamase family protein [candidate division KSB1 bacterium]|nr:beta-lactamase family protein [candidate division KSB1 bacterium]MDZ7302718.1 beta-lactamase family protein [candidate division KSB1 bacterium]MDZ7311751.1 beta-lactamase family protein [candidate division KSB1 bacterium]